MFGRQSDSSDKYGVNAAVWQRSTPVRSACKLAPADAGTLAAVWFSARSMIHLSFIRKNVRHCTRHYAFVTAQEMRAGGQACRTAFPTTSQESGWVRSA